MLFGGYVLYKGRDLQSLSLALVALVFSVFSMLDLMQWIWIDRASFIMASWSTLGILTVLLFFLLHIFVHSSVKNSLPPLWMLAGWAIIMAPVVLLAPTAYNISAYDIRDCIAVEGNWYTNYYFFTGVWAVILIWVSAFTRRTKEERTSHASNFVIILGATLFILSFLVTGAVASYLVDQGYLPDFGLSQYGVAAMAVFIGVLTYASVQYGAFSLKLFGAQALVLILVLLVASEFLFVRNAKNYALVGVTLAFVILFGYLLVRSVKREIEQREKIEKLVQDLEKANEQQVTLIHFITHQIKGFVTKSRNIFSMALEGDFGEVNDQLKPMLQEGFNSDTKGSEMIAQILNAANIRLGKVEYRLAPLDLRTLIEDAVKLLMPAAEKKSLALNLSLGSEPMTIAGDKDQLANVFRNLIDNSIKYTPSGSVTVSLEKKAGNVLFAIKDTGVGITPEDMKVMFTEGGHGKDSVKVNVESTGYGLYIVKQIVEGHKGRVWVESEGQGKGSQFYVEIPEK